MARRRNLTDEQIAKLPPRTSAYPDPELAGHYIRVRPTGKKSSAPSLATRVASRSGTLWAAAISTTSPKLERLRGRLSRQLKPATIAMVSRPSNQLPSSGSRATSRLRASSAHPTSRVILAAS